MNRRTLSSPLLLLLVFGIGYSQAMWPVTTLIPDQISVRMPTTSIGFGITSETYPPDAFPATYPATVPEGGTLPIQVFANTAGTWSLLLQIEDLVDVSGTVLVPAEQIRYRVDGGLWLRADGTPQIVYSSTGPTDGWLEVSVDFEIELLGSEIAGSYEVIAMLSALAESGS